MMNWNFATTTLAAAVLAVPALTLAPQAQDLRSSLAETVRALEALAGLAPRVAAGEAEALAQVKHATQPADMAPQQADERLSSLRDEVSRLRALHETSAPGAVASPFAPVTTGLTDAQKAALAGRVASAAAAPAQAAPVADLGASVDPLRHGVNAFRAGRFEECLRVLSTVKDQPQAAYWRGRAAERLGRVDEAVAAYEEVVKQSKDAELAARAQNDLEFLRWRRSFDARVQPRASEAAAKEGSKQ